MSAPHVVCRDGAIICLHCGQEYKIGLPVPIRILTAIVNTYVDMHITCPKPAQESPHA